MKIEIESCDLPVNKNELSSPQGYSDNIFFFYYNKLNIDQYHPYVEIRYIDTGKVRSVCEMDVHCWSCPPMCRNRRGCPYIRYGIICFNYARF